MTTDIAFNGEEIFNAVSQYLDGKNPEVEYKIQVDRKGFTEILSQFMGMKPELSQTTNAIHKINVKGVGEQRYNYIISKDYSTNTITKYTKQRLVDAMLDDFPNIKLSISLETPVKDKPTNASAVSIYRIKNRISFMCGDWRYDFTQAVQLDPNDPSFNPTRSVKSTAINLFSTTSVLEGKELIKEFISNCRHQFITSFEIEIELLRKFELKYINSHSFLDCPGGDTTNIKAKLYYDLMLRSVAVAIGVNAKGPLSIKRLLPNAGMLTKAEYNRLFPPIGYYISRKADGERALIIATDRGVTFLLTSVLQQLNNFDYQHAGGVFKPITILEGEIVSSNHSRGNSDDMGTMLVYDVLLDNSKSVIDKSYAERIAESAKCCGYFKDLNVIKVLPKKVHLITEDLHGVFKQVETEKFEYPDDGFVMTEATKDYFNTKCYKIKEHNTIDFLTIKLPTKYFDQLPIDRKLAKNTVPYLLFCSTSRETINNMGMSQLPFINDLFKGMRFSYRIPIHFAPSDNPYAFIWYVSKSDDKKLSEYIDSVDPKRPWAIVEMDVVIVKPDDGRLDKQYIDETRVDSANSDYDRNREWKLVRIREDRYNEPNYFGNDFVRVALVSWMVINDPLLIKDMHLSVVNYFKTGKGDIYAAQTNAVSFIKYKLFEMVFEGKTDSSVIDLAVGKGQDLNKYTKNKVARLLGIDIDRIALNELLTRYYDMLNSRNSNINMNISIMRQDLTEPAAEIFERIKSLWQVNGEFKYPDVVICNLAIHYFIKNIGELANLGTLLKSLMPSGSVFMYTTFNGKAIYDLLESSPNGEWLVQNLGAVKYRILKKYQSKQFHEFGLTIQAKLPFTGEELYEENLVDVELVNHILGDMGFKVVKSGSFADFFPILKSEHPMVNAKLDEDDLKFISLYQYNILICG